MDHPLTPFLIIFAFLLTSPATAYQAKVVGISDGDTIVVLYQNKEIKLRLHGIDCPEIHQAFGKAAKKFTSEQAFGKVADIESLGVDRYGRTVALVTVAGTSLNESLLINGLAWVYTKYYKGKSWYALEAQARTDKIGLWSDPHPTPPWEFRRSNKAHIDEK